MKKIVFLLLTILLFSLNYGCSKRSSSKETAIKECKNTCSALNDPNFCSRICEKEILNPRWKFYGFDEFGSAWFYDLESISTSYDIVSVWIKKIYSEEARQKEIKESGERYKELDYSLGFSKIDCSKRRGQPLGIIVYAFDGSIINQIEIPESSNIWQPIPPDSMMEKLFKEVCKKSRK
jgi:hypothetical protein